MNETDSRPRRSCLYMPASNERALEKAKTLPADTIIFDLEDAVAPDAKDEARSNACAAIFNDEYGSRELVVRVNAMETPWFAKDMEHICASNPAGILVPKVRIAKDIYDLEVLMDKNGAKSEVALWVMVEMPLAVLNIAEIAALAKNGRLTTFVMGFNDLAKEMGAEQDRNLFTPVMAQTIMAARAHGMTVIDSVYNDFSDPEGLAAECEQARKYGFDGKSLIHPSQIDIANNAFSPSREKIEEAEAIISAFAQPENEEKGVLVVDGKMTERLHLQQAEELVAISQAIKAMDA